MIETRLDVLAIGNAIVDIIADCDDGFLEREGLTKGMMRLIDAEEAIEGAAILYLEGYLWDPETPRYAMVKAIDVARRAARRVAFTLSDTFCIDRHRDGFNRLVDEGKIDLLFANEAEVQALAGVP